MSSRKLPISFIVHTKNEEDNISECILSAKSIVDEIIVIDMQSHDQTAKLAKKAGAKIFKVEDVGFADPVRNFGISQAKNDWIFYLDADERLPKSLIKKILEIVDSGKYDVTHFPFKNIFFNKWIRHTGWWPDFHPRLFRKGFVVWPEDLKLAHFPPTIKGKVLFLDPKEENAITHYNALSIDHFLVKMLRYIGKDNFFEKNGLTTVNVMNYIDGQFKWRFFDKKGHLDKTHGFVLSKLMEFYWFLNFVKYWESKNYPDFLDQKLIRGNMSMKYNPSTQEEHETSKKLALKTIRKIKKLFPL